MTTVKISTTTINSKHRWSRLKTNKVNRPCITYQPYLFKLYMNYMKHARWTWCTAGGTFQWLGWRLEFITGSIPSLHSPKAYSTGPPLNSSEALSTPTRYYLSLWWSSRLQARSRWLTLPWRMFFIKEGPLRNNNRKWSPEKYLLRKSEDGSRSLEPWGYRWRWSFVTIKRSLELILTSWWRGIDQQICIRMSIHL